MAVAQNFRFVSFFSGIEQPVRWPYAIVAVPGYRIFFQVVDQCFQFFADIVFGLPVQQVLGMGDVQRIMIRGQVNQKRPDKRFFTMVNGIGHHRFGFFLQPRPGLGHWLWQ